MTKQEEIDILIQLFESRVKPEVMPSGAYILPYLCLCSRMDDILTDGDEVYTVDLGENFGIK